MAVTFAASIMQAPPSNGVANLTFTDASTGISGLISRTLQVLDYNNNLLATYTMGSSLVQAYPATADGYYQFVETIVDASGTTTGMVDWLCTSFYISVFAPETAAIPTYCDDTFGQVINLSAAQNNRYAALDMASLGQGVVAQQLITYANFLLNTPYYSQ